MTQITIHRSDHSHIEWRESPLGQLAATVDLPREEPRRGGREAVAYQLVTEPDSFSVDVLTGTSIEVRRPHGGLHDGLAAKPIHWDGHGWAELGLQRRETTVSRVLVRPSRLSPEHVILERIASGQWALQISEPPEDVNLRIWPFLHLGRYTFRYIEPLRMQRPDSWTVTAGQNEFVVVIAEQRITDANPQPQLVCMLHSGRVVTVLDENDKRHNRIFAPLHDQLTNGPAQLLRVPKWPRVARERIEIVERALRFHKLDHELDSGEDVAVAWAMALYWAVCRRSPPPAFERNVRLNGCLGQWLHTQHRQELTTFMANPTDADAAATLFQSLS